MGSQYFEVLVFALVALFIGLRLRSVLGRRTGNERQPPQFGAPGVGPGPSNVTPLRPATEPRAVGPIVDVGPIPPSDPVAAGFASIRSVDPSITADGFLSGAGAAFDMILRAFAQGDETALRPLLADDVFQNFTKVIRARREAGETCENKLVRIVSGEIVEAGMAGRFARVTVRFVSQQIIVVKDAQGAVVEGDADKTVQLTDLWTFERDPRSKDPNWALVATRSQDE
jgi:predicted lipid-binding transport protein (Tim44 family)